MKFNIHISPARGRYPRKFTVPAVRTAFAGVYSEVDRDIFGSDKDAIRHALPALFRQASGDNLRNSVQGLNYEYV